MKLQTCLNRQHHHLSAVLHSSPGNKRSFSGNEAGLLQELGLCILAEAACSVPHSQHCVFVRCRLMSSGTLRKLLAGWNQVNRLAERVERSQLEVLDLQHNHLTELPHNIFMKAQRCAHVIFFFLFVHVHVYSSVCSVFYQSSLLEHVSQSAGEPPGSWPIRGQLQQPRGDLPDQ